MNSASHGNVTSLASWSGCRGCTPPGSVLRLRADKNANEEEACIKEGGYNSILIYFKLPFFLRPSSVLCSNVAC